MPLDDTGWGVTAPWLSEGPGVDGVEPVRAELALAATTSLWCRAIAAAAEGWGTVWGREVGVPITALEGVFSPAAAGPL